MITIVDYGVGNLRSVLHKIERLGHAAQISADPKTILTSSKLILPGVGHFGQAMRNVRATGLRETLDDAVLGKRVPILGICLGMQLLTSSSEEGDAEGFGWIPAVTRRFDFAGQATRLRVPNVGWNVLIPQRPSCLLEGVASNARFYFTHSYFVRVDALEHSVAQAHYGIRFDAIINRDHIWGTQFHPEKSHLSGLQLIRNFLT